MFVAVIIVCVILTDQVLAQFPPCPDHRMPASTEARWPQFFKTHGPIAFLDSLRKHPRPIFYMYPVRGWVKKGDIPKLLFLLDSSDTCANVTNVSSSFLDLNRSTVGREAAFLIMGFRCNLYPPSFHSNAFVWPRDSILLWWKQYQADSASTKR